MVRGTETVTVNHLTPHQPCLGAIPISWKSKSIPPNVTVVKRITRGPSTAALNAASMCALFVGLESPEIELMSMVADPIMQTASTKTKRGVRGRPG